MYPRPQRSDRRIRTTTMTTRTPTPTLIPTSTKQETDQATKQATYEEESLEGDHLKLERRQKVHSSDQRVSVGQPEDDGDDGGEEEERSDSDDEEDDEDGGNDGDNNDNVSDDSLTAITAAATTSTSSKPKKVITKASSINISDYDYDDYNNDSNSRYSTSEISAANSSRNLQSSPLLSTSTSQPASPASLPAKPSSISRISSPNQRLFYSATGRQQGFLTRSGSELLIGSSKAHRAHRERSANKKRIRHNNKQEDQHYNFYFNNQQYTPNKRRNLLQRSLSTSSIFSFYLSRYAREKFYLALRTFKSWYHEQLTYHHLSRRMEFNQQLFEQWFRSKGRPLSLRAMDRYDQIVIWIAGKLFSEIEVLVYI